MASYKAIVAVGQAITQILTAASESEASKAHPDETIAKAKFSLLQAGDFTKDKDSGIPETGATIYLYRINANASCRNLPPRKDADGKTFLPSLPLDLYFLITPWAPMPDAQNVVLGWIMRVLEDTHHMPATLLNHGQPGQNVFFPNESIELIFDPLPLSDMSILWENLKTEKILPSVTYVVRGLLIDSYIELPVGKSVQTRDMDMRRLLDAEPRPA